MYSTLMWTVAIMLQVNALLMCAAFGFRLGRKYQYFRDMHDIYQRQARLQREKANRLQYAAWLLEMQLQAISNLRED